MFEDNNPMYPRMPLPSPIILRVWEGDYGVPSVDPTCLELMTLFKIHRLNVVTQNAYYPQWLDIPSIQYEGTTITKGPELMPCVLRLCKKAGDNPLQMGTQYRLHAYKKYFVENFADVFYFDCWLNEPNYEHAIKPWFSNVIPFPFDYFYLKKTHAQVADKFKHLVGPRDPDKFMLHQYKAAVRCLDDFTNLLKDGRRYFFGDFPTPLDATIYSYLVIAMHMPLPDSQLQNAIKSHQLLERFVVNMTEKFFPNTPTHFKYVEPVSVGSDRASNKSLIIAGVCATAAMVLYACNIGLIRLQLKTMHNL